MSKKSVIFVIFAIAILLTACNFSLAQDITPPPGYQPPVLSEPEILTSAAPIAVPNPENGRLIYTEKCQACHGPSGLGDGPDSTGLPNEVARLGAANVANLGSPLEWYSVILQGNLERFMPPFSGSLSPADVWDVLAYVYTFSADPAEVTNGGDVFSETCAACHSVDGSGGEIPGAANLLDAERMVLLSVNDLVQKIATGSGNDEHVFSTVLDAGQIEAAALYVRALTFPLEGEQVAAVTQEPTLAPTAESTEAAAPTDETDQEPAPTGEAAVPTEQPAEDSADLPDDGLGTITGVVVNGSGGDLPEGLEVSLEVYEAFELVYEEVVPAAVDGSYKFENIAIDPDLIYITLVESEGAFFPSAFHMGNQTVGEIIDLPITIYDVTNQSDALSTSRVHVFFQFTGEEMVQVIHQVTISNSGTKMVAPERQSEPVVQFTLPEGAVNLIFQSGSIGNPYVQTAAGFADPTPIQPGLNSYEILYAYNLPFEGKLDWQWLADLPVDVAVIFVQGDQVKVESDTLLSSGTEAFEQEVFQVFIANDLNAGETLDLRINTPFFSGGQSGNNDLVTIALGIIGLALAGFGAWRFFAPVGEDQDIDLPDLDSQEDLIAAIIALDEDFEAGVISEKEYQTQRDLLKSDLARLVEEEGIE